MTKTKASRQSYKALPLKAVNIRKGTDIFLYNLKNTVLSRYFLYLDPYEGYREDVSNKVYLCNFKK
jgi:hypothetical protein